MNSLKLFGLVLLLTLTLSCGDDDSPIIAPDPSTEENDSSIPPTIDLISGGDAVYQGVLGGVTNGTLQYEVEATAEEGFVSLVIYKILDGVETAYETVDKDHQNYINGSNVQSYELTYSLNKEEDVGKALSFRAVVIDAKNNSVTLDFANAEVQRPLTFAGLTLQTIKPPNGDITVKYYLHMDGNMINAVNHDVAVDVEKDQDIIAIFSINDDDGYYLSSPASVEEIVLVNGMQEKASTKFKHSSFNDPEIPLSQHYSKYDVYQLKDDFVNQTNSSSHEEKAEFVNRIGKIYYFLTDNDRTGVIQVKDFFEDGNNAYVRIELLVSQ